jgi:hypothetical protein
MSHPKPELVVTPVAQLRALEGRQVSVALADGSRIDDCHLVSAPRGSSASVWIFANGADHFVPHHLVIDIWEAA